MGESEGKWREMDVNNMPKIFCKSFIHYEYEMPLKNL